MDSFRAALSPPDVSSFLDIRSLSFPFASSEQDQALDFTFKEAPPVGVDMTGNDKRGPEVASMYTWAGKLVSNFLRFSCVKHKYNRETSGIQTKILHLASNSHDHRGVGSFSY